VPHHRRRGLRHCGRRGRRGRSPGHTGARTRARTRLIVGGAREQIGHDRGRAGQGLGGQLSLDRPQLPRVRVARDFGPGHFSVGQMPGPDRPGGGADAPFATPPCLSLLPGVTVMPGQAELSCRDRRIANTARICASRPNTGRVAVNGGPVTASPERVSQHDFGPGPRRPVCTYRACRHRATMPRSRSGRTPRAAASRS